MSVRIVQLGSPRSQGEGLRIGTVRRPPRGVPKKDFARRDFYDVWLPILAPTSALVDAARAARDSAAWRRFVQRYRSEMKSADAARTLDLLAAMSQTADFSVGCYCADEARCHRSILRELLLERGAKLEPPLGKPHEEGIFSMRILTSVLSAPSQSSSIQEVAQFVRSRYGVVGTLDKLGSERDENYRITLEDGAQRLFKLTHVLEDPALVDFQTRALEHVARWAPELPVPRVVPSLSGELETSALGSDGRARRARLFTFLPGAPLAGFARSGAQARALGELAARLDAALASFHHPAAAHEFLWDIQHALATRELLPHTRSAEQRDLCAHTLERFERGLARELGGFRRQVIHNDLNPHNLLVDPANPDQLTGLIDFGDMVLAPLIDEAAVASAYLLTASPAMLGTVPEFLAAYHSTIPLQPGEIAALPQLIALRHAISILISNWRAARYPDNRDYIVRNQHHAVAGLQKLAALPESAVHERLLDACAEVRP